MHAEPESDLTLVTIWAFPNSIRIAKATLEQYLKTTAHHLSHNSFVLVPTTLYFAKPHLLNYSGMTDLKRFDFY